MPRKRRRRSWLLSLLGFGFASGVVLFLAASAVAGFFVWQASRDLPDYESLAKYEPPVMTRIHAHDGSLMAEYARERRIFVPINVVPKLVIAAFLSAEDKRFYEHGGLDFAGIARAVFRFVEAKVKGSRRRAEGASTITQQVAKNFLLTSDRTIQRKMKEAILSIRIERTYSKDKILELYLNEIYLGLNSYGIAAAALNYFNKELSELTIEEAAYLAALPKAPNNYHPFRRKKAATTRRNWVIDQMAEVGYITAEQATEAKAKPLTVNVRNLSTQNYAADYFAEDVRRTLTAQFGDDGLYGRAERTSIGDGRVNGGLSVRTTLDPKLQRMARQALVDGLVDFDRNKGWRGPVQKIDIAGDWGIALGGVDVPSDLTPWRLGVVLEAKRTKAVVGLRPARQPDGKYVKDREAVEIGFDEVKWAKSGHKTPKAVTDVLSPGDVIWVAPKDPDKLTGAWSLMQIPEVGGGLVAMDPHTGRVRAVAGGFSFATSQFDRALQAKRQPGSAFKPLVYAAALDNGYKPTSIVLDAPIEIEQGPGKEVWQPKNYDGTSSFGPSTLRLGIEKSRNQMTVRLAQDMGMPLIVEYAKRFGAYDDLLPVLAMSLGSGETTLVKMAAAYSSFVNGGRQVHPTLIDRIQDRWGHTIWRHDKRECTNCKARSLGQPARAGAGRRPPPDHRPAHRLSDGLDAGGRGAARHRHRRQQDAPQRADRRQDRHHQRREGRLVHRLHPRPRRRRVYRLRHSPPAGQGHDRRPRGGPHLRQLLEDGAGRQESGPLPHSPRHQAGAREPAHGAEGPARRPRQRARGLQALRGARRRLFRHRLHRRQRRLFRRRPDGPAAQPVERTQRLLIRPPLRSGYVSRSW